MGAKLGLSHQGKIILYEVKGNEAYQVKIPNRFAALENSDDNVDINRAWETIRISVKESVITN
jgi:hypothetical protein